MGLLMRHYGTKYLYNEGDEYTPDTGGWVNGYSSNTAGGTIARTKETNSLRIYIQDANSGGSINAYMVTEEPIDLTNYSIAEIRWRCNRQWYSLYRNGIR